MNEENDGCKTEEIRFDMPDWYKDACQHPRVLICDEITPFHPKHPHSE